MVNIKFELNEKEVELIIVALAELPYKISSNLIEKIISNCSVRDTVEINSGDLKNNLDE